MIIVLLIVFLAGAVFNEAAQFRLSQFVTLFRKNSPLVGNWRIAYERDDKEVIEELKVYAEFAGVAYGELHAKLVSGSSAIYRVRFEHRFESIYSVSIRPASAAIADFSMGLVEFDAQTKTAKGKVLALSLDRHKSGEAAQVRDSTATKS